MNWIEIAAEFDPAPADWSILVDMLFELGCPNTVQTDSPPAIVASVIEVPGSEERVEGIASALRTGGAKAVHTKVVPDEDWAEVWKQYFHPRRIGKRFWIQPTWEPAAAKPGDIVISLDPGQAFGTGDHPTTRLCLELLERLDPKGQKVADIGCGSGILSIGASLLGASQVSAVDIDPVSVEVAKQNAELNGVRFEAVAGEGIVALDNREETSSWDVVLSNIISATLVAIAPDVAARLSARGAWIVSGIITQNWEVVEWAADNAGFTLAERLDEDGWVAATFIV